MNNPKEKNYQSSKCLDIVIRVEILNEVRFSKTFLQPVERKCQGRDVAVPNSNFLTQRLWSEAKFSPTLVNFKISILERILIF